MVNFTFDTLSHRFNLASTSGENLSALVPDTGYGPASIFIWSQNSIYIPAVPAGYVEQKNTTYLSDSFNARERNTAAGFGFRYVTQAEDLVYFWRQTGVESGTNALIFDFDAPPGQTWEAWQCTVGCIGYFTGYATPYESEYYWDTSTTEGTYAPAMAGATATLSTSTLDGRAPLMGTLLSTATTLELFAANTWGSTSSSPYGAEGSGYEGSQVNPYYEEKTFMVSLPLPANTAAPAWCITFNAVPGGGVTRYSGTAVTGICP